MLYISMSSYSRLSDYISYSTTPPSSFVCTTLVYILLRILDHQPATPLYTHNNNTDTHYLIPLYSRISSSISTDCDTNTEPNRYTTIYDIK